MPFLMVAWGLIQRGFGAVLAFCSKPPGSWIAAALGLVLVLWWFGQHEFNRGEAKCEARRAEAAAQELARQKTVFVDADTRSAQRTSQSETVNANNRTIIRVIREQAGAMPDADDVCISPDFADRLRELK